MARALATGRAETRAEERKDGDATSDGAVETTGDAGGRTGASTSGAAEGAFTPRVSAAYAHAFPEASAKCWCVDVWDEEGVKTTMSITKAVPRVRKIQITARTESPVLIEEEVKAIVDEWNERTRIERARRAKARRKAAEAERKAEAETETEVNLIAESVLSGVDDDDGGERRKMAPPPGFRPRTPPGFAEPTYKVVHVPVVDPAMEARQRALEAQVAELQAQLAAQKVQGGGFTTRMPSEARIGGPLW
ncbi:hypothetical protein BE221DRAFT_148665 [Ostreococcus tauri]|uniref:Uncharacterized protein n=1 Tax=Ostreococcus tauri TaxID=70448 RepID=A0A1Y5IBK2_OSTTA|nr:hypothetical protein BE221DRAFT_148665 [Ostreococcus tauri]